MAMKFWTVKKGNKSVRDFEIRDKEGVIVDNLGDATAIKFQIKKNKTDVVPLVEKDLILGIEVNKPDPGWLRITLLPNDTGVLLDKGDYFMAIQITWSPTDIYEVKIEIDEVESENFRIKQDIIQS